MTGKGKKRRTVDDELGELHALAATPDADAEPVLRRALRERSSLVAERAASIARERNMTSLEADLGHAFERFLQDGVKRDPGCRAKLAALEALDFLEAYANERFLTATRYVQLEPQWGAPADTAVGLRSRAVLALARRGHEDLPLVAGELLADPEWPVREAAAVALGIFGGRANAGPLLLALATKSKDEEPQVTTACMQNLLLLAPDWALPKLREALFGNDEGSFECALLALAQSGRDDALALLLEYLEAEPNVNRRGPAIRALGLHRTERALAALLDLVANGSLASAKSALQGLAARRFDVGVFARTEEAVRTNGAKPISAAFAEAFADATR